MRTTNDSSIREPQVVRSSRETMLSLIATGTARSGSLPAATFASTAAQARAVSAKVSWKHCSDPS